MLRRLLFRHHQPVAVLPASFSFPELLTSSPSMPAPTVRVGSKGAIGIFFSSSSQIGRRKSQSGKGTARQRLTCCFSSTSSSDGSVFIISSDDKYGSKQVISMTPSLYDYVLDNVREPEVLRKLREETAGMRGSQMRVSPDQAQLLAMLVRLLGAERCIEVGVYTGYSALAIALVLPESGCLVACERDEMVLEIAKRYFERAGVLDKVHVKHGVAIDTLNSLLADGGASSYDFAFIDADKRMYKEYYELLLQLVRVGGAIVIDNVLWHGNVADPLANDKRTVSIRNFNKYLLEDARVDISMVPIGDGMTICRKRWCKTG